MNHRHFLIALLCSLVFSSAWAQEAAKNVSATTSAATFISGGVGDDSMAQLVAREKEFDLKLFLVGQSGSYLSDIRITIIDANGKGVLLTSSEGPVLLADLPAGTYTIKAQKNGHTLTQKISVTPGKLQTTYFRFPGE